MYAQQPTCFMTEGIKLHVKEFVPLKKFLGVAHDKATNIIKQLT